MRSTSATPLSRRAKNLTSRRWPIAKTEICLSTSSGKKKGPCRKGLFQFSESRLSESRLSESRLSESRHCEPSFEIGKYCVKRRSRRIPPAAPRIPFGIHRSRKSIFCRRTASGTPDAYRQLLFRKQDPLSFASPRCSENLS